ncbi:nucleolar protein 8 isoform X2 [Nerophis lumbriciformis]|uniref:nucleolar protein 8 isoform X2 n=1 Tax=Nerophis lumbriciformis TaxID=546530 RepID=UPI003BAA7EB9
MNKSYILFINGSDSAALATEMQRLYVGGLSHTITQKDLKDRFGKFGGVEDVELRTRKDDDGVPYKTFAYINIKISDTDLKKCMTVLNKSKWKGGTLQIEPAKESFLHRLAQERQAELQRPHQPADCPHTQMVLESLSQAGVDNFTMKAAVPGTEIPGHKDWVVSKFGRVLPVMQLKCQQGNKSRTLKYDPSKYCHNIRKLVLPDVDHPTPVTQLTWDVDGGDDDISRKRRGEFPAYKSPRPKKSRTDAVVSHKAVSTSRPAQPVVTQSGTHQLTNGFKAVTNPRPPQKRGPRFADSDADSDEEIRHLVAIQQPSHDAVWPGGQDDNLEVVGCDYLNFQHQQKHAGRPLKEEEDYDSADTDELFASRKPHLPPTEKLPQPNADNISGRTEEKKKKAKRKTTTGEEEDSPGKWRQKQKLNSSSVNPTDTTEDEDSDDLDSDYEAMFSNVTHLEISLADLQKIAEEFQKTPDTPTPAAKLTPAQGHVPKKGILPEEILASLLRGHSSDDKQKTKKTALPAFQGTRKLNLGSQTDECRRTIKKTPDPKDMSESSELDSELGEDSKDFNTPKVLQTKTCSTSGEDEEDNEMMKTSPSIQSSSSSAEDAVKASSSSASHSEEEEEEEEDGEEEEASQEEEERQRKDNTRRPAAVDSEVELSEEDKAFNTPKVLRTKVCAPSKQTETCSTSGEDEEDSEIQSSAEDSVKASPSSASHSEEEEEDASQEEEERRRKDNTRRPAAVDKAFIAPKVLQKASTKVCALSKQTETCSTSGEDEEDNEIQSSSSSAEDAVKASPSSASHSEEEEEEEEVASQEDEKRRRKDNTRRPAAVDSEVDLGEEDNAYNTPKVLQKASTKICALSKQTETCSTSSEGEEDNEIQSSAEDAVKATSSSSSHSEDEEEEEEEVAPRPRLSAQEEEERQRKDNTRRLAAVQQRQKEAEELKKLIQRALANVDAKPQRTGKHIVFDSDADDDDDDDDEQGALAASKKSLLQNSQSEDKASGEEEAAANNCHPIKEKGHLKKSGPQLFSSSEDEDEDGDEEEDQNRFDVRPQFEGPAGQKLMELQSRFGTDERFRMDSRFLEEEVEEDADMVESGHAAATVEVSEEKTNLAADDDQALQEEKKRNMSILHNVLGLHPPTGKTAGKAKTFRDVSALHYDPSKEEHAAFETKTERIKKNSKSARRKKREEAQKLPEVSKEIFYDVTGDLKAMFGQTNDAEEVKTNWDQVEEEVDGGGEDPEQPAPVTSLVLTDASAGTEDPSGFTFSFFGNDLETESEHPVPAEYKVESIQAAKVSWQQDPHLQDSSSEEEEVEEAEEKEKSIPVPKTTQEETPPMKDMFFFHLNDSRLLEGPQWFCCSSELDQEREQWQERAMVLKEECRRKHKNALRKLKPHQKR